MLITIGREHGSGGHEVARILADKLGIPCYSKEIVDEAAAKSPFSKEILDSYDERRVSPYVLPTPHYMGINEVFRLNLEVASAQFQTIRDLADQGNCVFVGRCADYVLRGRNDLLRVFIMAEEPFRVKTMMDRRDLTEDQARKEVDKDRSSYYRYYTDQIWGQKEFYDLCVNSGRLGVRGAVKMIAACVESLEGEQL